MSAPDGNLDGVTARAVPGSTRRNRDRGGAVGDWITAPGPIAEPPSRPAKLGAAGVRWWEVAVAAPVSSLWTPSEWLVVERGAMIAQRTTTSLAAGLTAELRQIETELGLTHAGLVKRRILPVRGAETAEGVARDAAMARLRDEQRAEMADTIQRLRVVQ